LIRRSSLYCTTPVGYADQPDFVNAVAEIETRLSPDELLEACLEIERKHGRNRTFKNAPRTLDLDILLYGDMMSVEPRLTLPHPRMHERAFVLVPLAEIAPDCVIPRRGCVADLVKSIGAETPPQRIED
jgi:2-amino-4-hydroxy-6-hydroxymethyldihydropteridine diphosphokinase